MSDRTVAYRPDIDGLRAIAVMAVFLFHLDIAEFGGGFVGVDVFFVISGYLITRLIVEQYERDGSFDYARFYLRRARRLFPALFFTLAASFAAAFPIFGSSAFADFAGSAFHAVLSLSNFYFWQTSGYFDADSSLKPLLHTWSLSVEEQFYLFWPVILVLLMRSGGTRAWVSGIGALGLASLALNVGIADGRISLEWTSQYPVLAAFADEKTSLFYLTPFRVFEFAIGAMAVPLARYPLRSPRARAALSVAGLAAIGCSVALFDERMIFPYWYAIVPCAGTAMVILAADNPVNRTLLSNPVFRFVGLISYSLYLVHWPAIVFYRTWYPGPITPSEAAGLIGFSLITSFLMYRYIETPFRKPAAERQWSAPAFGFSCAMLACIYAIPTANAWATGGWNWRVREIVTQDAFKAAQQRRGLRYRKACRLADWSEGNAGACDLDSGTQVLVLGDSHLLDAYNILHTYSGGSGDVNLIVPLPDGGVNFCGLYPSEAGDDIVPLRPTPSCLARADALVGLEWDKIDIVALGSFQNQRYQMRTLRWLMERHPHLKALVFGSYIGVRPLDCASLANRYGSLKACADPRFVTKFDRIGELASMLPEGRYVAIEAIDLLCRPSGKLEDCLTKTGKGAPIFLDGDHFTLDGADELAAHMKRHSRPLLNVIGWPD